MPKRIAVASLLLVAGLAAGCAGDPEPVTFPSPGPTAAPTTQPPLSLGPITVVTEPLAGEWTLHPDAVPLGRDDAAAMLTDLSLEIDAVQLFDSVPALLTTVVPGTAAIATWSQLRDRVADTGRWPVIMGPPIEVEGYLGALDYAEDPQVVLDRAQSWTWDSWSKERADYVLADFGYPETGEPVAGSGRPFRYSAHIDVLSGDPLPEVTIALVGTPIPWEVPAHLGWGGWNDNPEATGHVVALRHWHQEFGAEVVAMAWDIVETRVQRPPADEAAALDLAREQYIYAYDIVDQGTGEIESLAGELLDSAGWYFWWD